MFVKAFRGVGSLMSTTKRTRRPRKALTLENWNNARDHAESNARSALNTKGDSRFNKMSATSVERERPDEIVSLR